MTNKSRVVVVGAGIIGSACAYRLAESGIEVVVVDAGPRPGDGSTSSSSAIVRFHYNLAENVAMAWDSHAAWADWGAEIGQADPDGMPVLRSTGGLLLGEPDRFGSMARNLIDLGIAFEVLEGQDIQHRWPAMDVRRFAPPRRMEDPRFWDEPPGELVGGLYTPDGGYVNDPQRAAATYAYAARRHGAVFRHRSKVTAVLEHHGRLRGIRTAEHGDIPADLVINAAGPASDLFNRLAGDDAVDVVRSRPLATETHVVPAPAGFAGQQGVFVLDPDLGSAFRPEGADQIHVSCVEPECDPLEWVDDPWSLDPRPTQAVYETQTLRVARRLPGVRIPNKPSGLRALYDVTPDWNMILDRSDVPGLILACGTSGNSFKTAPSIAHCVTALVKDALSDGPGVTDVLLPRIGRRVSLAPFGRHRRLAQSRNVIA